MHDVFVQVGERLGHPVYGWAARWWELLDSFAAVAHEEPVRSTFDAFPNTVIGKPPQLLYPVDTLPDEIQAGMTELAAAIYAQDVPAGGLGFVTGFTALLGERTGAFFASIPPFMRRVTGNERVAVQIPIRNSGDKDGTHHLHADLFQNRVLMNVFQRPLAGEGHSYLLHRDIFLAHLARHTSQERLGWISDILGAVNCDSDAYDIFWEIVWEQPYSAELRREVESSCIKLNFAPGEGYWVHDGTWLHGRDYLSNERATFTRLHRWTYNNKQFATQPEHEMARLADQEALLETARLNAEANAPEPAPAP